MRPIKLTLEGFTSFRQRTEIDFTGLDLFAIAGPTGSGKTSIIDAITYALYGQTSRLGAKGLGELITQGASRLSVMFEFESRGKRFQVARVLKRSGPAASVRLSTLESDGVRTFDGGARDIAMHIAKSVGLDFDGFTKAVVLPQGQFDQFLRGDPARRREILEALLNAGVYREMMQRANARHRERQTERDLINSQLEREYADATEENRNTLTAEIKSLTGEGALVDAELKRVELERLPAIELRQKRQVATTAEQERKTAEEALASEQKAEAALVTQIQQCEQSRGRMEEELRHVPYDEGLHQKLIALLPVAQQIDKIERDHAGKVKKKREQSKELDLSKEKLQAASRTLDQAAENSGTAKQAHDAAKERFETLKKKYGSADMVEHVADEIGRLDTLEQQLRRDQEEYVALEKKQTDLTGSVAELQLEEIQAKKLYDEAQVAYEALFRKHSAEELRKHLKRGEPCPVCEQVVDRLPKRVPAARLEEAKAEAEKLQHAWHKKQRAVAKTEADLAALPSQLQSAKAAVARTSKQITAAKQKAERILGKVPGPDASGELKRIVADLRAAESDCTSKEEKSNSTVRAEAIARETVSKLERETAVLAANIQSLSQQIDAAANEMEQLRTRLVGVGDANTIQTVLTAQENAKRRRTQIEANIEKEHKAREEAQKQRGDVNTRIAGLKAKIEILNSTIENAKSEAAQIERSLKTKLAELTLPPGTDEADRIDKLLSELRRRCGELTRQIDQKQLRIEHLDVRITEAQQKRERIADLEHSAQLYAQLGALLRADQFMRFVLEGAFQLLCDEGTRQLLVLSQGRYSFHTEGNEFHVIDHWNADERRSVRTLSGGESFLASLALALALSSSVSQFSDGGGPFKLDALFLDEGFSTLDAETLNVAIEALQVLQQGDRMIAVISHVTDLAERLPSRIQVSKGVSGSEISLEQAPMAFVARTACTDVR